MHVLQVRDLLYRRGSLLVDGHAQVLEKRESRGMVYRGVLLLRGVASGVRVLLQRGVCRDLREVRNKHENVEHIEARPCGAQKLLHLELTERSSVL